MRYLESGFLLAFLQRQTRGHLRRRRLGGGDRALHFASDLIGKKRARPERTALRCWQALTEGRSA